MIDWLLSLSLWALAFVLGAWLIGFSLVSLWALRRWLSPRLRFHTDASLFYGAAVMQSGMVLYGLVAALTAVTVWTRHSQVSDTVSVEATAIGSVWRSVGGYPQPQRDAMRDTLRTYTRQIIQEAWPEQRQGHVSHNGSELLDRFQDQLLAFEPTTESQKILHAQSLAGYSRMVEARRQRLDAVDTGLATVMWVVLLCGAMGSLLLYLLYPVEDGRYQALLVVGLAIFLAMVLFVIVSLDRPLQGPMAIAPDSYELMQRQLMQR